VSFIGPCCFAEKKEAKPEEGRSFRAFLIAHHKQIPAEGEAATMNECAE
jgi:hypothetical protein